MKTHGILNLIAVSVIAMTVETASAAGPAVARSSVLVSTDAGPVRVSSFSPGSLRITRGRLRPYLLRLAKDVVENNAMMMRMNVPGGLSNRSESEKT